MTTPAASTAVSPALDGHQGLAAPADIDEAPTAAGTAWPTAACSDQAVRVTSEGLQGPLNSMTPTALDVEHDPAKMPATHRQASASSPSLGSSADQAARKREHAQASAAASAAAAAAASAAAAAAVTASAAAAAAAAVASASAATSRPLAVDGCARLVTSSAAAVTAAKTGEAGSGVDPGGSPTGAACGEGVSAGAGAAVPPPSLAAWLKKGPFVLSMSPGFFGFYAHIGALIALEDADLLQEVSFATGASAGGLVAGLFAAGLSPAHMGETVVKFRRSDFWDPVGLGGLLRGKKFEDIVNSTLPAGVRRFDQCRIPLAVSAFDVSRLTTRRLQEGCIAQALRATCTFPGLFAPVWHERGVLVDGGIRDTSGMWCVPEGREDCRRILNVTFGHRDERGVCFSPSSFPTASNPRPATDGMEIVSLPLTGLPRPHPFAMERGVDAMEAARSQVAAILQEPLLEGCEASHWVAATEAPVAGPAPTPPAASADQEDSITKPSKACIQKGGATAWSGGEGSTNGHRGEGGKRGGGGGRAGVGAEVGVGVEQASSVRACGGNIVKGDVNSGVLRGNRDGSSTRSSAPGDVGGLAIAAGRRGLSDRGGVEVIAAKAEAASPAPQVGKSWGGVSPSTYAKTEAAPNAEVNGKEPGRASKRGHQASCDARGEGEAGAQLALPASSQEEGATKKRRLSGETSGGDHSLMVQGATNDDATPEGGAVEENDAAAAAAAVSTGAAAGEGSAGGKGAASGGPEVNNARGAAGAGGVGGTQGVPTVSAAGPRAEDGLKRAAEASTGGAEGEKGNAGPPTRTSKRARRPKVLYPIEL